MIGTVGGVVAVLVLLAANAYFVAVEFGLVAVDRTKVDLAVEAGDHRASVVAALLRRLSFHLSGVQFGITVCSVVLGVLSEPVIGSLLRPVLEPVLSARAARSVSVVVALIAVTVLQMVLSELIPKAIAVAKPMETIRALAPTQRVVAFIGSPIIRLFDGAATGFIRRLGIEPAHELSSVRSRHELVRLVASSGASGTMATDEAELVTRAFRFTEKTVAEALTPRPDVLALPLSATGADLAALSVKSGRSRFPVYDGDLDDVVGVVHVKALFDVEVTERSAVPVMTLMTEPVVVPESRELDSLLAEMRHRGAYLVVVADEYGGTAGIITLEDLLEELVGEIDDEHDEATAVAAPDANGEIVVGGGLHVDEVEDATGFEMPDGDYETIAGFALDRLGRIPEVGAEFEVEGWRFRVVEMDRRRVARLSVTQVGDEPEIGDDDARG